MKGFTLIEYAIVVFIIGILLVVFVAPRPGDYATAPRDDDGCRSTNDPTKWVCPGYHKRCIGGVLYIDSYNGMTALLDRAGKPVTCGK